MLESLVVVVGPSQPRPRTGHRRYVWLGPRLKNKTGIFANPEDGKAWRGGDEGVHLERRGEAVRSRQRPGEDGQEVVDEVAQQLDSDDDGLCREAEGLDRG